MTRDELADSLIRAKNGTEARKILASADGLADLSLAYALKEKCYSSWTNEPAIAQKAAHALQILAEVADDRETDCVSDWIAGISDITKGKLESSVNHLRKAYEGFAALGKPHEAAQTQVAKLIPLGLMGAYERAEAIGKDALRTFESLDDELAAGKIEMNLANIFTRQGRYREAKEYCTSARNRFHALGETQWLLMAENDLAMALAELSEFEEAENRYIFALEIARKEKMHVTEADILANLGNLQTFRGQYGRALRSLELSRKKYTFLEMPHRSVIADSEMAEIYQILNLTEEAEEIYRDTVDALHSYRLRAEEARARGNYGKLALSIGELEKSEAELEKAAGLYLLEDNPAGAATVRLVQISALNRHGEYQKALELIGQTDELIAGGEFPRLAVESAYLRGETLRLLGSFELASQVLNEVIVEAKASEQFYVVVNGLVSSAKIAIDGGDLITAERSLREAVEVIEHLRAPIPAEGFRMAFLADKLVPFELLSKVCLKQDNPELAFSFTEQGRSRTLFEKLADTSADTIRDGFDESGYGRVREKLNWYYSRLAREAGNNNRLREDIARIEKELAEIALQDSSVLEYRGDTALGVNWENLCGDVRRGLGEGSVMIEYTLDEEKVSAFVIDHEGIQHFENITTKTEINDLLEGMRFQFESMRFSGLGDFEPGLKERADRYLEALYDALLAPLTSIHGAHHLIIVPVGPLFYVPFNALFDGSQYTVEKATVSLVPSAAIWSRMDETSEFALPRSLVIAFSDEKSPLIDREAFTVAAKIPESISYTGDDAVLKNYFDHSENTEIIHLACHGEFRADSPLYSNLRLADGFLTVRDIAQQRLSAGLVTLSACETGLNRIYAGEEILGLARGFLGAGAKNIVMSLWTVNDEATNDLMETFYGTLVSGRSPAESLQKAQIQLINSGRHPYFWASFVMIGK